MLTVRFQKQSVSSGPERRLDKNIAEFSLQARMQMKFGLLDCNEFV